jgi:hypothetical protein
MSETSSVLFMTLNVSLLQGQQLDRRVIGSVLHRVSHMQFITAFLGNGTV